MMGHETLLRNVDTGYQLEPLLSNRLLPDQRFIYDRISEATVSEAGRLPRGRVLDVGSGGARELTRLAGVGWQAFALDASSHMLALAPLLTAGTALKLHRIRAIGERLPFTTHSFDAVLCQVALDHFADRTSFIEEAARVVRPEGRVIISLYNFDGLTCRLGRALHPLARASKLHHCADWPCWSMPQDHTFKGNWQVVKGLGGERLTLESAYGVSLLCMFYGWGHLLARLPGVLSECLLRTADRFAYRRPSLGDVIVSVWRPA